MPIVCVNIFGAIVLKPRFNPLPYGIWSAVHNMAGGSASHPREDNISESKGDSGGRLHSCTVLRASCIWQNENGSCEEGPNSKYWGGFPARMILSQSIELMTDNILLHCNRPMKFKYRKLICWLKIMIMLIGIHLLKRFSPVNFTKRRWKYVRY